MPGMTGVRIRHRLDPRSRALHLAGMTETSSTLQLRPEYFLLELLQLV